jgi:hypothetical protein
MPSPSMEVEGLGLGETLKMDLEVRKWPQVSTQHAHNYTPSSHTVLLLFVSGCVLLCLRLCVSDCSEPGVVGTSPITGSDRTPCGPRIQLSACAVVAQAVCFCLFRARRSRQKPNHGIRSNPLWAADTIQEPTTSPTSRTSPPPPPPPPPPLLVLRCSSCGQGGVTTRWNLHEQVSDEVPHGPCHGNELEWRATVGLDRCHARVRSATQRRFRSCYPVCNSYTIR